MGMIAPFGLDSGDGTQQDSTSNPGSGLWDTFMSDTVGVLYRAGTGKVDPWTQNQINTQAATDISNVSNGTISYDDALSQVQTQSDQLAQNPSVPSWWDAFKLKYPDMPSWLPYAAIGAGVLLVLWVLRPYIIAVEE